ncbi:Os10g0456550, partial [Oryza sativa Japonica Group]
MPSSIRIADKLAALKHFELIDDNPSALLNSSTFSSEASQLYNAAMSLRLLCISRQGVGSEGEGVGGVGLGEAAEEGERGAVGDEVVRVRVHRRRLLRRAPQRRVLGLHLHLRRAPAPAVVVGGRLAAAR